LGWTQPWQVFRSRNNNQSPGWKARLPELTVLIAFEPGDGPLRLHGKSKLLHSHFWTTPLRWTGRRASASDREVVVPSGCRPERCDTHNL